MQKKSKLGFPYPYLIKSEEWEYICFAKEKEIKSKYWEMRYIENINEMYKKIKENPTEIFPEYNEIKLIEEDQIIVKDFEEENSILTVPKLDKMNETYPPTSDINGNYIYKKNPIIMGGKYEGRYKLLTIGVPVSNQIDTIERCMKGIMPILQTISSELIVVDTGSTDGTVEITKKYGAKVIQFPWCDNMSAARNQAVYAAEGLWYMSIDDDEWFEDVTGILDFFQSGEYKNYNAAAYLQRNYMYENDIEYNDFITTRIAKITPTLHFEGRIHDALWIIEKKEKLLDVAAHHKGFAYMNDFERAVKKSVRNLRILQRDLEEYPFDMRYSYQFANEYGVMSMWRESFAYYIRGMVIMKEIYEDYKLSRDYKVHMIRALLQLSIGQSDDFFYYTKELVKDISFSVIDALMIYYLIIQMDDKLRRPLQDIFGASKVYEQLKKEYEKDKEACIVQSVFPSDNPVEVKYRSTEYARCMIKANIKVGNEEECLRHLQNLELKLLPLEKRSEILSIVFSSKFERLTAEIVKKYLKGKKEQEYVNLLDFALRYGNNGRVFFKVYPEDILEYVVKEIWKRYGQKFLDIVEKWEVPYDKKEYRIIEILKGKKEKIRKRDIIIQEKEELKKQLRENILILIKADKIEEAKQILREYLQIYTEDIEMKQLFSQLEEKGNV